MDDLKNKIESNLITKTFHVSGMPESIWKDVDDFCKEFYGDSRWVMIVDLMKMAKDDYRFNLIYKQIEALNIEVQDLKQREVPKEDPQPRFKTFG